MIRRLLAALAVFLCVLLCSTLADEARDLTAKCSFKTSSTKFVTKALYNRDFTNRPWKAKEASHPYVAATAPQGEELRGIYICFADLPDSYVIQVGRGSGWETLYEGSSGFHHAYYDLPEGTSKVRIYCPGNEKTFFSIHELYLFGRGDLPEWVQRWQAPLEKADILFIAAHPDDDLIFFGGAIPTYAGEYGRSVAVAYLSYSNVARRSELLNALWSLGVRNYPYIGSFRDNYSTGKLKDWYNAVGGEDRVLSWLTSVLRTCRPEVVVSQDPNGEYGHPQHKMLVDAVRRCFDLASDAGFSGAKGLEPWQVKKLYLHLWPENRITMDWSVPLSAFGGKTGLELADEAYTTFHRTQKTSGMSVRETGNQYDNRIFGLVRTEVGPDENRNDFLEHIPAEALTGAVPAEAEESVTAAPAEQAVPGLEPEATAVPAEGTPAEPVSAPEAAPADAGEAPAAPAEPPASPETAGGMFAPWTPPEDVAARLPRTNANGFLDEGEFVLEDEEAGLWVYISQTLKVIIRRTYEMPDRRHPFYCFTAHVWCDTAAGELPHAVFADAEKPEKGRKFIREIASENNVVFATSTDYYTYRSGTASARKKGVGIIIRGGEIFYDSPRKNPPSMPNYETLAFFRDGSIGSWLSTEKSAKEYLAEGAYDVYCFGPCLLRGGEFTDYIARANKSYNPRYALGEAEPGHYVAILCEGRLKRSKGVQMPYLAQLLKDQGCRTAVNLDGGQTAVFCFMGKQLNQVVKSDPNGRKQPECLAFGQR